MKQPTDQNLPIEEKISKSLMQTAQTAEEIERQFLNLIINNVEDIPKVIGMVKEEDFTNESNQCLYKAIISAYKKYNGMISFMQIAGEVMQMNYDEKVPIAYIMNIQSLAVTGKTTAFSMAKVMFEVSMIRRLMGFNQWSYDILRSNESKDLEKIISDMKAKLDEITDVPQFQTESIRTVVSEIRHSISEDNEGVDNNFIVSDNEVFNNFFRLASKEMIVIGARQKSGKTKVLISLVKSIFTANKNVAVFWISIEDDKPKIIRNIVSTMCHIPISDIERNKLTHDQRRVVNDCLNIIEGWDMEIHYEKPTVEVAAFKYQRFQKNRKDKFCIFIYDNFNGAVDVERFGDSTVAKSEKVAGAFQSILTGGNQDGAKTMMIILDHLRKDYNKEEAEKVGYRPTQSDLISSERKLSVLTQLVLLNKPGLFKPFVESEDKKPAIFFRDKTVSRKDILSDLIILEMVLNRNGGVSSEDNSILRVQADLGKMRFSFWKENEHCSVVKADVKKDRGIDNPDKLTFEMVRDELHSINPIGDINKLHLEICSMLGKERKDKMGIITFDFLITRYKEYVSYFATLQNDKFTKKENKILSCIEWIFNSEFNNRHIKPSTGDDAARDSYLYNM